MEMNYALITLLVVLASSCQAAKLPSGWTTCKLNDPRHNECMRKAIQGSLPALLKGIPKLGINSIDPMRFETLNITQGSGPVSINLLFTDFDLIGMKNGIVEKVQNDNWKKLVAHVKVPVFVAKSKYKVDGKVLVLPVKGEGNAELRLDNFTSVITVEFSEEKRNGKTYYHMDKMHEDVDCELMKLKFENLFNGNKQLGDQMNLFLNENWREIYNEIKPAIAEAMSQAFLELSNRLFSRIPKNEITPP